MVSNGTDYSFFAVQRLGHKSPGQTACIGCEYRFFVHRNKENRKFNAQDTAGKEQYDYKKHQEDTPLDTSVSHAGGLCARRKRMFL